MSSSDDSPSTFPNGSGTPNGSAVPDGSIPPNSTVAAAAASEPGAAVPAVRSGDSPIPFVDLQAPEPMVAAPPVGARWLAFGSILVGGLFGGMIGYGTADLLSESTTWVIAGLLVGALSAAAGVGVVAALTLRAMNEWKATSHPEAAARTDAKGFELRPGVGRRSARVEGRRTGRTSRPRSGGPGRS